MDRSEKKPIGLLFANLKGNIGDFAILEAILRDLSRICPDRAVKIFPHGHLTLDKARIEAFEKETGFKLHISTPVKSPNLPRGVGLLQRAGVWPFLQKVIVNRLSKDQRRLAKEMKGCEFLCFAGGDHWNGMRLGPAMFGALCLAERVERKVFCYPFSCNPAVMKFNTDASLRKYFGVIEEPLIVRDSTSYGVISKIGVEVVAGTDSVYSLRPLISPRGDDIKASNKKIIISVTSAKDVSAAVATSQIIESLNSSFKGADIEILSTCEIEDSPVFDSCEALEGFHISYPATWQEAVERFRSASVVITNRLHALILCSMCEAVVLPITNREKSKAFAIDAGLKISCSSASAVSAEIVESCIKESREIQSKLRSYSDAGSKNANSPFM